MIGQFSPELLKKVLHFLPRLERVRLCSTCKWWRDAVVFDAATWRHICCGSFVAHNQHRRIDMFKQLALMRQADALPVTVGQLVHIPNLAFVEILIVLEDEEDEDEFEWSTIHLSMILSMRFPCLRALRLHVELSEYVFRKQHRLDKFCSWLCSLPASLEYIDLVLYSGEQFLEEEVLSWMTDRDQVF